MSVTEKRINFKIIEREIYNLCCEIGRDALREVLAQYDVELSMTRDKTAYRAHDMRKSTIKTMMGEVEYCRTIYEAVGGDGSRRYVYLLDEALGMSGSGFISDLLSEFIAKAACESSYRETARSVSELTGQRISHTAAWNVVQQLGKRLDKQEQDASMLAASSKGKGILESPVLFEEMDGIHLKLQGKSRKVHGTSREMKVVIAYDGAKKVGKERYQLTNKVACANFEGTKQFKLRKEGAIAAVYNADEIDTRLLNGDGADWIKDSMADNTHFQLDHFHISQAITRYVSNNEARKTIRGLLYSKQIDPLLDVIQAYSNSTEDEKERDNYLALHSYFKNNKDGLVPCHRRGLNLPEPPQGKVYRRLGAMESNIFTIIGNRMKGGRSCWSINGGNNLARLLCLKATGKLSGALQALSSTALPERYAEVIEVKLSAASIPLREGKGYNGFHKMSVPASVHFLKDVAKLRPI